jgi:hypothetical protein
MEEALQSFADTTTPRQQQQQEQQEQQQNTFYHARAISSFSVNQSTTHPDAVHYVSFSDRVDRRHNTTVDGHSIPGPFYNNQVYLLGARLVTSRDETNSKNTVKVMLFGQAGNYWKGLAVRKRIRCNLHQLNNTLLPYEVIQRTWRVQVYFPCNDDGDADDDDDDRGGARTTARRRRRRTSSSSSSSSCGTTTPMEMELIENVSVDYNVNNVTLQWIADVTSIVTKADLLHQQQQHENTAIRLAFRIRSINLDDDTNGVVQTQPLLTVDIPLSTGVVGHAGPQILQGRPSLSFLTQPSVDASICLAIYGQDIQQYLPQFVVHHLNVGFGQIIVGVDTTLGSEDLIRTEQILRPFVEDGTVVIAATGLPGLSCDPGKYPKIHFYNTCLQYSKGFSKYLGIWDIDEFWMPPASLPILTTKPRTTPKGYPKDDVWTKSNYSTLPSISQAIDSLQAYQASYGCGKKWCFHTMPSYIVFRERRKKNVMVGHDGSNHQNNNEDEDEDNNEESMPTTQGLYSKDFGRRDVTFSEAWHKSILRTAYTHMAGIHVPGSCWLPNSTSFVNRQGVEPVEESYSYHVLEDAQVNLEDGSTSNSTSTSTSSSGSGTHCRNLLLADFGTMHHFASLARYRPSWEMLYNESFPVDEYVQKFGRTVEEQLARLQFT